LDKRTTAAEVVAELRDGMTLGIGGWGSRRKPMALVREILRSPVRDLTLVCYGGPDVGTLCAAGRLRKLVYGFVSLDSIPLADDLFLMAAKRRFVSCERIVPTEELLRGGSVHTLRIHRGMVDGVVETPRGAHFTECPPDYGRDEAFQGEYAAAARAPESWRDFERRYESPRAPANRGLQ
jgi:acyl CoA:acetate/3-ketoacid CoA transferase alpha subunit